MRRLMGGREGEDGGGGEGEGSQCFQKIQDVQKQMTHPPSLHHIPQELTNQQHCCEHFKFLI